MKGVYGLLVEAHNAISAGRLGEIRFDGAYIYIGSAQGPGGLAKRIARHRAVASGSASTRHWHIDYLLGIGERWDALVAETSDPDAECALAHELSRHAEQVMDGFGASDCRCRSHLFRLPQWDRTPLIQAFTALNLRPASTA